MSVFGTKKESKQVEFDIPGFGPDSYTSEPQDENLDRRLAAATQGIYNESLNEPQEEKPQTLGEALQNVADELEEDKELDYSGRTPQDYLEDERKIHERAWKVKDEEITRRRLTISGLKTDIVQEEKHIASLDEGIARCKAWLSPLKKTRKPRKKTAPSKKSPAQLEKMTAPLPGMKARITRKPVKGTPTEILTTKDPEGFAV